MPRDLRDRIIIITGASSGIGRATALQCARAGMDVVLNARRTERLDEVAAAIRDQGRAAEIVAGDVADPATTAALLDAAEDRFGHFDAVFANAGYGMHKPVIEMDTEQLRRMFEVNFFASVELARAAALRLIEREHPGHLLMCSSCLAKFTLPAYAAYCATKAAQNHFCRAMHIELATHDIDVSSVLPITTTTEFHEVSETLGGRVATGKTPRHAQRGFVQTPERVARAVVKCLRNPVPEVWTSFLVRATSAFMTLSPRFADRVMRKAGEADGKGISPRRATEGHGEKN